ncbi:MAG: hypothetical protein NVSMB51_11850 [Solirubrobacteraceae bacterium]
MDPTRRLSEAAQGVATLILLPARALLSLESSLANLERIADGVAAMHGEFLGMREDIRALAGQLETLTAEVTHMAEPVSGINAHMGPLNERVALMDQRVATLALSLGPIGTLAGRFGGAGRRRNSVEAPPSTGRQRDQNTRPQPATGEATEPL